ncbi:Uncharacterised protein [Oligella urethralis]|uniref:hypothetical protein n=1 Tax=Oligella urethralis TaxID=90245 RepID=UPI000E032ADD|nr:hypothetical protein [Oligella urethralis]SUA63354.1 Uncharacterised protein [Oligella urethralis]
MSKKYGILSIYRAAAQAATHLAEAQVASALTHKSVKVVEAEKALAKINSGRVKASAESVLADLW